MPLQECTLNLNPDKRELMPHGTAGFPCAGYRDCLPADKSGDIPWHWHEEIEVLTVETGTIWLSTPGGRIRLEAGGGVFLSPNTLHQITAPEGGELHSLVFHRRLLAGDGEDVFGQKYVNPILDCDAFSCLVFGGKERWEQEAVEQIRAAFLAIDTGGDGYELLVREHLTRLWYQIYTGKREVLAHAAGDGSTDALRLRAMTDCIHTSYSEPLTLAKIAAAAHIGNRECLRCFKRTVGISPMQYLQKHRILEAARMLQETGRPIAEIAVCCGFDSPSNFSRTFKKYFLATPVEYRKSCGIN